MIYPKSLVLHPPKHTQIEIKRILDQLKNVPKNKTILEFGAETGRLTVPLLQAGYKVDVVEPDEKSAQILREICQELKFGNWEIYGNLPNKKYAAIVGTDVLHHVDMNKYFPEFFGHLDKGGRICFSEPNGNNILWYLIPQVFLFWKLEKGIRETTKNNLERLLNKYKFSDISVNYLWRNYRLIISARRKK